MESPAAALTGVNSAMTALVAASSDTTTAGKASDKELQSFGLSATTASGQLTPMGTIIDGLAPKYATMTQSQQLATSTLIFGASSAQAMTAVINAGIPALDAATASTTKTGTAQSAATTQSKTLGVEFKTLEATAEDWGTELGQVLIPVLGLLVKGITDVINVVISVISWFGKMSDPALAIAAVIGAVLTPAIVSWGVSTVTAGASAIGAWISSTATAVASGAAQAAAWVATAAAATAAFIVENAAMLGIGVAIVALVAGAVWLGTHWKEVWSDIKTAASDAWHFIDSNVLKPIKSAFDDVVNFIKAHWELLAAALIVVGVLLVTHWKEMWSDIKAVASDAWHFIDNDVLHPIESAFDDVVNFIKTHWQLLAAILLAPFAPVIAIVLVFHNQIWGYIQDLVKIVSGMWDTLWDGIKSAVQDAWNIIKPILDTMKSAISDVTKVVSGISSAVGAVGGFISHPFGLASGGIVTQPTLAVVGESGPEAVIPLTSNMNVTGGSVKPYQPGPQRSALPRSARRLAAHPSSAGT